ncbi:Gfo/Idh/MocA family protein [Tessaracoccus antarcticus]|uniref:Gfo/Idh/MocA family oxidoreductase n=1 Tax=Tessaracoccus antarcticus TaxID=2479848 RepID=A0A3M0G856_9ACTN|nr:Gfo/Idh/MocA family oxidoreductase [Tessaracoccus antarcticus]RMB61221.1 gfo/Idh/MocA family oxidoreductase [Tessaracoccus antarcticus]
MGNLRAGLIGIGMMGRHHARVLGSLEGVDLVGIMDPGGDKFNVAGGRPVFDTVEQLLELKLDYCMVAVPTALHLEVGLKLAEAGVHAIIEKPLAVDVVSSNQLVDAFAKASLVGAVGHIERYNPALQQARRRIAEGQLGRVIQVATRRQGPFPARIADVGVVKDLATHDIDLTAWVVQSRYEQVAANANNLSGRQYEDLISVTGRLEGGIVANHLVNWLSPLKERVTIITGETGTFVADTLTADLTYYVNGTVKSTWSDIAHFRGVSEGDVVRYAFPKPEPLLREHENFRDAVLGKDADIVTLEQGLNTVRVAEAVIESATTGETVTL